MEDKCIKKGYFAYQFRVDLRHTDRDYVSKFKKLYQVKYYIIGEETSPLGKEHFQCILWFETKISQSKLRNWWKGKTLETKQPVSLVSARKIKNLAKYTMKDKNYSTNLSIEDINKIGQWKVNDSVSWLKMLEEHAKDIKVSNEDTHVVQVGYDTYKYNEPHITSSTYSFVGQLLDFYRLHNKRPNRNTIQYLCWKYHIISNNMIINKWF